MLCVLGCLLNELGKKIKLEMLNHLSEHNVLCVDQNPPGKLFEFPAINAACKLSLEMNEPVLYLHTKGSGNPVPPYMYVKTHAKKSIAELMPKNAKLESWQKCVRYMWYNEFTGKRLQIYLSSLDNTKPMVVCPFSGEGKATWQNGFILNPLAAKELLTILKPVENRYWYEHLFKDLQNVIVKGIVYNDVHDVNYQQESIEKMHSYIWNFYEKEI